MDEVRDALGYEHDRTTDGLPTSPDLTAAYSAVMGDATRHTALEIAAEARGGWTASLRNRFLLRKEPMIASETAGLPPSISGSQEHPNDREGHREKSHDAGMPVSPGRNPVWVLWGHHDRPRPPPCAPA